jgi:hypothetical protein
MPGSLMDVNFGPGHLDWARAKRGFTYMLENDPTNLSIMSTFAMFSLRANDIESARKQFDLIDGRYFPGAWGENVLRFDQGQQAVYFNGKNPFAPKTEEKTDE